MLLFIAGCFLGSAADEPQLHCPTLGEPEIHGRLQDAKLDELSGVVASRTRDVLYAHNDSGDKPRLFVLGRLGEPRGQVRIVGAEAVDWEDIDQLPDGHLVIADIGDNDLERHSVQLYRIPEPANATSELTAERMDVRYPNGPANAETLLIDPVSGELYILTKVKKGASTLYALGPWKTGTVTAKPVATKRFGEGKQRVRATGGSISPDRKWIAIRTYGELHIFPIEGSIADAIQGSSCVVPWIPEEQGEAVTFTHGGLLTVSEGERSALNFVELK